MTFQMTEPTRLRGSWYFAAAVGLMLIELVGLGVIYKHLVPFNCRATWSDAACSLSSGMLVAFLCACGAIALYMLARPAPFRELMSDSGARVWPLGLNALGLGIALVPLAFFLSGTADSRFALMFVLWFAGAGLLVAGVALFVAPRARWWALLRGHGAGLGVAVLAGLAAPALATLIRPLWQLETIANITFEAVVWLIGLWGYQVETWPDEKIIGAGEFYISVAPVCSGIEGIALVTLFVTLYIGLFHRDLHVTRALLLYPIGIAASFLFNILRIAVLLVIGLEGNPELAVGGFHSHAGWMMFTIIALGVVLLLQVVPFFRKDSIAAGEPATASGPAPLVPFWQDPMVAAILPFAVFMLTAVPVAAFAATPGAVYPLRVLIVGAVMIGFLAFYRALPWRIDPVACLAGLAIGVGWVAIPVPASETAASAPYGALTGAALVGWYIARGFGTIVLVPVLEEVFFRKYLHEKLTLGTGAIRWILPSLVTAVLFAALHDRWAEAFVAGLIFTWVAHRKGGTIADAIIAHALANAVVFGAAVISGNLAII